MSTEQVRWPWLQGLKPVFGRSREEAIALGHDHIGTEHVLLAIVHEAPGVLDRAELPPQAVREGVLTRVRPGDQPIAPDRPLPFTVRVKKVFGIALDEIHACGAETIAPEHLLVALAAEGEGVAARVLADLGSDAARLRRALGLA